MTAGEPSPGDRTLGDGLVEAAEVMDRLWSYGGWEVTQTHESLTTYLVEETYELLDAVAAGDAVEIREELGDLLLQVLFHARIAEAAGEFTVDDVAAELVAKLAHRSPHLADDVAGPIDIAEQERAWEARKEAEKQRASCLDGIATSLPSLAFAEKVLGRARKAGLPDDLIPVDLLTVEVGENAEVRLRAAVLAFAERVRRAEECAAAAGATRLTTDDWRTHWT
ncbi:MazG family protein [Rhodococcus triatomae]|nr:nucleoside triphosphate pyrophosphohydrolase [Rhodococcus triatomae BKS 15-14]